MIKKIKVDQLKPGMFVHDFNCGWLHHPFFRNSAYIDNDSVITKILELGIREIYIDTERGGDSPDAVPEEEEVRQLQDRMISIDTGPSEDMRKIPVSEEMPRAKKILKHASATIRNVMLDVRFGRLVETEKVEHVVSEMFESVMRNQDALISLGRLKRLDEYTYYHSISVCALMLAFGKHLGYDHRLIKETALSALLHDIGKMMMPEEVLNKRGVLSETEYELLKGHVEHGRLLLEQSGISSDTIITTLFQHHEREDGSGYPLGLVGEEISCYGKTLAIADTYDAMTSDRCYKQRVEPTAALRKLFEWSRYYFCGELVQKFIQCIGIYPTGTLVALESGWIGVVIEQNSGSLLQPVVRAIYNTKTHRFPRVSFNVDLSQQSYNDRPDRIINYESPARWNIKPEVYL